MNSFVADFGRWPVLRLRSPTSDVYIESFFDIIDYALAKKTVFASVHDARGMPALDAIQRRKFADYIKRREDELRLYIAGHAVIVGSALERGIVTAVLWLSPAPFPVKVQSVAEDAETWACTILARVQREE